MGRKAVDADHGKRLPGLQGWRQRATARCGGALAPARRFSRFRPERHSRSCKRPLECAWPLGGEGGFVGYPSAQSG